MTPEEAARKALLEDLREDLKLAKRRLKAAKSAQRASSWLSEVETLEERIRALGAQ